MRMLLAEGLISRQQLDRATFLQATRGATIDFHLIAAGAITSEELVRYLVRRFPVVHWARSRFDNLSDHVVTSISPRLAVTLRIMPLSRSGNTVILGLTDPSRHHAIQEAAHYSSAVVQPVVISHADMNWALSTYYPSLAGDLAEEEVPVPLTQRVTREFESWTGTEEYAQIQPDSHPPAEEPMQAIPLVKRPEEALETRPLRPSSEPAAKAWADVDTPKRGPEVVKREAVVVGTRAPRTAAAPPVKSTGPVVTTTPVREAVSTTPVRQVSSAPVKKAVVTTPVRRAVTSSPSPSAQPRREVDPSRAVVADPIRTIGDHSSELARQASRMIPNYDSWQPSPRKSKISPKPPAKADPMMPGEEVVAPPEPAKRPPVSQPPSRSRRRGSHPLSRPRSSGPAQPSEVVKPDPAPKSKIPPKSSTKADREPAPEKPRRRTEGELIAAIDKADDRDQIVGLALEYLQRFAGRAVFFVVKSTEIRGFDIVGELTSRDAIRSFWVPTASPSTLRTVVSEGKIHFGALGTAPADAVLAAALGGKPERAMIVPVVIRDRVVGLLFADRLDISSPPWGRLERLAKAVGGNLFRLLTKGKQS